MTCRRQRCQTEGRVQVLGGEELVSLGRRRGASVATGEPATYIFNRCLKINISRLDIQIFASNSIPPTAFPSWLKAISSF